jgi:hypothetical protein
MAFSAAPTIDEYLASLPAERRAAIARVRSVVNARLPRGYEETMQYGAITWIVPASRLAETYNGQPLALACLASQKQHMALYLMSIYGDARLATWFKAAYKASGKKLDMGKSCVRFKALDALPLDVIGDAIAKVAVDDYVARYHAARSRSVKPKPVRGAVAASPARKPRRQASKPALKRPKKRAAKPRSSRS